MYIEEITIEGFKSYAQRVVVPNFDPYFNAITGLNGSGKSNILDSICFVLGITNLSQVNQASQNGKLESARRDSADLHLLHSSSSKAGVILEQKLNLLPDEDLWMHADLNLTFTTVQVRANSLQELVYKQGQAGVTKASVSIVFNNQDKQNSPVGYENFDQLTVTRQVTLLDQMQLCIK